MNKAHKRRHYAHREDLAGEHPLGDLGQLILLIVFIIGIILDLFIFHISESWQTLIPWYLRGIIFLFLFILAGYFGTRSYQKIFGETHERLQVINTGVYARMRHPMYFSALLLYLGVIILSLSLISLIICIGIIMFYVYLCIYEERLLLDLLGDEYRHYMHTVPMLFPKIRT